MSRIKIAVAFSFVAVLLAFTLWCFASVVDVWANRPEEAGEQAEYAAWNLFNLYTK